MSYVAEFGLTGSTFANPNNAFINYSSGVDFGIYENGTNRFYIEPSTGSIGIGTNSPDGKMDIDFGSGGSILASTPGGNGPGHIFYSPNNNRWNTFASNTGFVISKELAENTFLYLDNVGKCGLKIGNMLPSSDLHIKQTTGNNFNVNGVRLVYGDNSNYWNTLIDAGNDYLLAYNGNWRIWFFRNRWIV